MKQYVLGAFFAVISCYSLAQIKVYDQTLESKIKDVKVYMTGAEIERTPSLSLKKGRNKLIFKNISAFADASSIQFNVEGKYRIISMNTEMDYLNIKKKNTRIQRLSDSVTLLSNQLAVLNDEEDALRAELDILKSNKSIKGKDATLSVQELKDMADFVRVRTLRIKKDMTKNTSEQSKIRSTKYNVQAQLNELNYSETNRSNQIIIIIDTDTELKAQSTLKYVVSNCGWASLYDVIAEDVSGKIQLVYKAKVFNDTGNDWDYVDLTLSTGNPNMSATAPTLPAWFLNYNSYGKINLKGTVRGQRNYAVPKKNDYNEIQQNGYLNMNNRVAVSEITVDDYEQAPQSLGLLNNEVGNFARQTKPTVKYRELQVSQLASDFKIDRKYTIPADSKPYTVEIANHELNATFSHIAIPKMDKDAFLLANITGWEDLDLVPGPTKVYFGGNYVGQSEIDTRNVDDTLGLSFGRDPKILVARKVVKEFTSQKVIGNNRKDTYSYEILVKNNRNTSIELDLYDQVPISNNSEITVSVDEISGANQNEATGELDWRVKLNAGESKKYTITFTIKYPKNKRIKVKNYRTISAPSF